MTNRIGLVWLCALASPLGGCADADSTRDHASATEGPSSDGGAGSDGVTVGRDTDATATDGHASDGRATDSDGDDGDYDWGLPPGFPTPFVPPENPMTAQKVALGRHLFYDTGLSGNDKQACATCHEQALAFAIDVDMVDGSTGEPGVRNPMSLGNVAYNSVYTWANPVLDTLEEQILIPILGESPVELGGLGREQEVLQRFRDDPLYVELFAEAFADQVDPFTLDSVRNALAAFMRTMITGNSPYDRFTYQKQRDAMTEAQRRGMEIFFSEKTECHHCHGGFNFTLSTRHVGTTQDETTFHNTGLYNIDGKGAYPADNTGLYAFTGKPEDMGKFRAPTLRNVALTAPYMHDGTVATLEDVVRIYEAGGRVIDAGPNQGDGRANPYKSGFMPGFSLTDQERDDLIAFLESLTDEPFVTDARFSNPFADKAAKETSDGS